LVNPNVTHSFGYDRTCRDHWIPILALLSEQRLNCWGTEGRNLSQWAVAYHCSLAPLIQFNMWPPKQNFKDLLLLADREQNVQATVILKVLCEKQPAIVFTITIIQTQ